MISLPELIAALQNLNYEPTDEDIADMLWLALHMGPPGPEEPISHSEKDIERLDQAKESDDTRLESQPPPPQPDLIPKPIADELYLVTQGEEIKASGPGAVPFETPKVSALPGTLGLARALRPLMRRVPSRTRFIVDEEMTAQQIAEQGIWLPVLNPAPARWLELALVIDESMSLNIWWQTIAELQLLLEHHGAFRDVRTWGLVMNTDGNNMQLRAGLGITTGKQQLRNPSELIEPSGRRLILVVSDCVSSSWYTGAILEILASWGHSCPVAIIQVLPRWLWTKSVLRESVTADLYTRTPGLPNMQLDYSSSSYWMDDEELKGWLPMPVVTLEQKSLSIWAKAIVSAGNAWMPGYMFDVQKKGRVPEYKTTLDQKAVAFLTAEQRLKRFRTTASPTARALTELLAATPITVPIVRLIQQSMLSESQKGQIIDQQGHVAEIFLSGLLEQLPLKEDVVDPDQVQYDFVDGVRELLLSSLPRSESVQVLMKFTDFIESHADLFPDLTALLADPMSATEVSLTEKNRPFAIVTAQVLRRLGGGYIPLAEQIERVSTDLSTKVEFPESPIEAPFPVYSEITNTANTASQGYKILSGSERKPLPNSRPVGPVNPGEQVEVTVYLRAPATSNLTNNISEQVQRQGRPMSRQEYIATQSASPDDLAKVEDFARKKGLTVVETDPVGRRVVLAGTATAMSAAFATELQRYEHPDGTFRGRTGPLHIPSELDQVIVGVFGLDNRPQILSHFQSFNQVAGGKKAKVTTISYTSPQIAQLYGFQTTLDGSGQCIAFIELGGGYKNQDLQTYFGMLGLPLPKVTSVSIDGGGNHPAGTPDSADGIVGLDIEVAGAIAPGAHIVVYFAPNTNRGFLDAITKAIHDTANNPSVISISWGSAEVNWTVQAMQAIDQAFQAAAALGITVCCAAGNNGSGGGVNDGLAHVNFPASSPYALGCGGTRLEAENNHLTEVVWNDGPNSGTGGGVSDFFVLPTWQANAGVPLSVNPSFHVGRGVPDVAGNADPQTGYNIYVNGQSLVLGGTGATASLWAGLIALMNQQRGQPVGYLNPILYQNYQQLSQANALRDVTSGNNGAYSAGPGWDACTGLGSPNGKLLWMELTR